MICKSIYRLWGWKINEAQQWHNDTIGQPLVATLCTCDWACMHQYYSPLSRRVRPKGSLGRSGTWWGSLAKRKVSGRGPALVLLVLMAQGHESNARSGRELIPVESTRFREGLTEGASFAPTSIHWTSLLVVTPASLISVTPSLTGEL